MSHYDIAAHGVMVRDDLRMRAYERALALRVTPGCTVVDVGTGTGLHAMIACRLGAGHVYAVEEGDVIEVAREIARDNGFDDRVTFFHATASRVELPQPADVLVSDMRGVLPLFAAHLPSIIDARERLLRPGGALIPQRDELWIAPIEDPAVFDQVTGPWDEAPHGFDLSAARRMATQRLVTARVDPESLLAPAQRWAEIDYRTVDVSSVSATVRFELARDGKLHGFALWFDGELADGVTFSNAPSAPKLVYGAAMLPLPRAVASTTGDEVTVSLRAHLVGEDYVWKWDTRAGGSGFSQSTFHGMPLALRSLSVADATHAPVLSAEGVIDRDALDLFDGNRSVTQIVEEILVRHPEAFASEAEARARVVLLAHRYLS